MKKKNLLLVWANNKRNYYGQFNRSQIEERYNDWFMGLSNTYNINELDFERMLNKDEMIEELIEDELLHRQEDSSEDLEEEINHLNKLTRR
tara:strand:- start:481 stop:753 length:273 start_codon:yes stop_codon:yes gene_type:complete